jgi:hypothetical protein
VKLTLLKEVDGSFFKYATRRREGCFKLWGFNLNYIEVSEFYETWTKIFLLHLVLFKIICRVCCYGKF